MRRASVLQRGETMALRDLLSVLARRLWLLIVGGLLAMIASYLAFRFLTPWPRFQATATVLIGRSDSFDWTVLQMGRELAPTYVEWAQHRSVLQSAIDNLNLSLSFEELLKQIDVQVVKDTHLVEIRATSDSPGEAAAIANEVAWQLARQPLPFIRVADATRLSLQSDITALRRRIDTAEAELAQLGNRLAAAESDEEIDALTRRVDVVQGNLEVWRRSYAELRAVHLDYLESVVAVAEEAVSPSQSQKPWINILVAGVTGMVLAVGLAFLLEHLDNTVKTTFDVAEHLSVPALGVITPWPGSTRRPLRRWIPRRVARSDGASKLRVTDLTHLTNAYRHLSASIARLNGAPLQGIVLVTSPTWEKDKGMTALGLAMALADAGQRTLLVDASLRDPELHTWLELPNEVGLVSLLEEGGNDRSPDLSRFLCSVGRDDLRVMTSGPVDGMSPDLLLSPRLQATMDRLTDQADLVLLNGPPVLVEPETATLATKADTVLLVLEARKTRIEEAQRAVEVLSAANGAIAGAILSVPTMRVGG